VLLEGVLGARSPWLGLMLMFWFLGLAKIAEPLFTLRLPTVLRAIRPREVDGPVYRILGVRAFGRLLRETPLRYLNPAVYLSRGRRGMVEVYRLAESAEASHFWAAVLFTPWIGYVGFTGRAREAAALLAVQVAFNVYPILHLRIVRERLDRHVQGWRARPARRRGEAPEREPG
jgi:hypothetical protein